METLAPPVVAVVVAHDPGPWFEETLASLGSQDYAELSVLVLDNAGSEDLTGRVAAVLPTAYVRRLEEGAGVRGGLRPGPVDGGRGRLLPLLPRRHRPLPGRRPPPGGGGLPLQRRDRGPQGGGVGRPRPADPRGHGGRQVRLGRRPGPAPRDRPRPARRGARCLRGARGVHPDPGRPLRGARWLRPRHRGHGRGPRPVLARPGRRGPDHRGARRPGPPPRGAGRRRTSARATAPTGGSLPGDHPGDPPGPAAPSRAPGRPEVLRPLPPVPGGAPDRPPQHGRVPGGRPGRQPAPGPGGRPRLELELPSPGHHPATPQGGPGPPPPQRQGGAGAPAAGKRPPLLLRPARLPVRVPRGTR